MGNPIAESSISKISINDALFEMLLEAFEATDPPGWFEGLLVTLERVDAATASRLPAPGRSSVASHVAHVSYSLGLVNAWLRGESPGVDWSQAWQLQVVDEATWKTMIQDVIHQYEQVLEFSRGNQAWTETALVMGLKNALHVAYHVGAIRQILPLVRQA